MKYLKAKDIIYINHSIIETKTPDEIRGVREPGALEMLVQAPREKLFGEEIYPTIFDKAAILFINIATKHVFHNANKRTAFVATDIFMKLNGYQSDFQFDEAIEMVLWIVSEHEKNQNFEAFKKAVASKFESKYMKK